MLWFGPYPRWLTSWWNYFQPRDYLCTPSWILILPHPLCVTALNNKRGSAASISPVIFAWAPPSKLLPTHSSWHCKTAVGIVQPLKLHLHTQTKHSFCFLMPCFQHHPIWLLFFWEEPFGFPLLLKCFKSTQELKALLIRWSWIQPTGLSVSDWHRETDRVLCLLIFQKEK